MAREVTLNDPKAVQFIRENFVPWAGNNVDLFYDKKSPEKVHEFAARCDLKQGNTTSYQVVAPGGMRIAAWDTSMSPGIHHGKSLIVFLGAALEKTGRKPPRVVTANTRMTSHRGVGVREKSARLAVATRRTDKGPRRIMIDSYPLPMAQLNSLRPPKMALGIRYPLPAEITRSFAEVCIHGDSLFSVKPEDATIHKMSAEVTRADGNLVEVSFRGDLGIKTNGKWQRTLGQGRGQAQGRLRFSRGGQLNELLLVYEGHFHNWYSRSWDPDYPVKGFIEWRRSPVPPAAPR